MRSKPPLTCLALVLLLAGCGGQAVPSPAEPGGDGGDGFEKLAVEVARQWSTSSKPPGFVPLQELTVPPDATFDDGTRQAYLAGWYRQKMAVTAQMPKDGTIRYPDGAVSVPLISADRAYRELDHGDPPPCPGRPAEPAPSPPSGPDGAVSSSAGSTCLPLTVTRARLGTVHLLTTRGTAQVPAWLFHVEELGAEVGRVAVAQSAVGAPPALPTPSARPDPGLVAAQDLTAVRGAELTFRLGIGACDRDAVPLVRQTADAVVVGGRVTRATGICTEQLLLSPVTVRLDSPLGTRPVLDAVTGQVLVLRPTP